MSYPLTLPFPIIRFELREKLLTLLILISLLVQPIVGIFPPRVAPVQPAETPALPITATTDIATPYMPLASTTPATLPYALPPELVGKPEIASLRSMNSATFDLGGNQFAVLQEVMPLHYRDVTGAWQHIDPAFKKIAVAAENGTAAQQSVWLNNANTIRTVLAEKRSQAKVGLTTVGVDWQPAALEVVRGDKVNTIATPRTDTTAGTPLAGSTIVRYTNHWSMAALQDQWQSRNGNVEYTMRLPSLPEVPWWQAAPDALDLRVQMTLRPGTTLEVDGDPVELTHNSQFATRNSLVFTTANGEEMILNAPTTYEQGRRDIAVAGEYVLTGTDTPNVVELRVRTPWSWLAAPDRQFPVIIDPLFQVRNETQMNEAIYDRATLAYKHNSDLQSWSAGVMGSHLQQAFRLMLRFEMPKMPAGTTINKAFLLASPTDIGNYVDEYSPIPAIVSDVSVYAIQETPSHWYETQNAEPIYDINNPLPPGPQMMAFSKGQESPVYSQWDVTTAAQAWNRTTLLDPINMGLILRQANEQCVSPLAGKIPMPNCGLFLFDRSSDNWTNDELVATQYLSGQDAPYIDEDGGSSGVRLIVYYSGPTLVENDVVGDDFPGGLIAPAGNTSPYFGADHLYTIPTLPTNRWQAVVSRSFTETVGPDPNTCSQPCAQRTPLHGLLPMKVQINDSEAGAQLLDRQLQEVVPSHGDAGYILFNGRGAASEYTDTPLQLRVTTGEAPSPVTGYDVRLINEQPTPMLAVEGGKRDYFYELDSNEPMVLWNLSMAVGSVNRIKVTITGDGTRPQSYVNQYAGELRAQIVRSNSQALMPASTGGEGTVNQWALAKDPTFSSMITAEAQNYAFAISYHGPRLTVWDEEECGKEFCNSTVVPIKYGIKIEVTSCAAGEFPTKEGGCQQVQCPNTTSFPSNTTNYEEVGGMRLWSKNGWIRNANNTGHSAPGNAAPLIGPAGSNSPTIALIGGTVNYAQAGSVIQVNEASTALLIQCPAYGANGNFLKWFDVYDGAMARAVVGLLPVLRGAPVTYAKMIQKPWLIEDQPELSQLDFTINPNVNGASRASGAAHLRRTLDDQGQVKLLNFNTSWSWSVDGWPSLASSVGAVAGNPQPPTLASLIVGLGQDFTLDTEPAHGQDQRRFLAIRATVASITQPPSLGGASRNLEAVILPRNAPIPEINRAIANRSALDLRNPSDEPNLPAPHRKWDMPEVLTNIDANTLMMSAAGNLTVYSSDHPNVGAAAANDAFSKEFNFGAGKAKVSVDFAPCGGIGPDVFIVNGEADIKIPNVGGAVGAKFMLCETSLRSVHMKFESPVGIPLGQSGMFLVGLHGGVDIFDDYTRITVGLDFQGAPGGNGGLFKASGTVIIDTRGLFEFQGTAKILGTVDASGKIWVAWNPLDTGFEVSIGVGDWLKGFARAHLWQGQGWQNRYSWLPDNDDMHFAGQIGATLILKEGAIADWELLSLPPADISIGIEVAFGEFCVNSTCTVYEWGIKGKFIILGYDVGLYYGFDEGLDFILGNDDHLLVDQFGGYAVTVAGVQGPEQVMVQSAPATVNGEALIPFTVKPSTEQILVAIGWQAGAPTLSLINPDGVEINAGNAAQHGAQTGGNATTSIITVQSPKAGAWQAKISNLSEQGVEHYKFIYLANKGAPGAPGNRGQFVNPVAAGEAGTNSYLVRWTAPEDTPDTATVSLYYYRTEVITGNLQLGVPIVKNLAFKTGQYQWDTSGLLNGQYTIRAEVDDGINELLTDQISLPDNACLPANGGLPSARAFDPNRFPGTSVFTSTGTIAINDVLPPATPTGLQLYGVDHAIMARWTKAPELDVNSYLVRWYNALQIDPNNPVGVNQALVTGTDAPEYRIGAVTNNLNYVVQVAAVDVNGNTSPFTAPMQVNPGLSGNPLPNTPLTPTVQAVGSESAIVSFNASPGPAPATYRVEMMKLGQTPVLTHLDIGASGASLSMETGSSYLVRVAGGNSDNWFSDYSAPVTIFATNGTDANGDGMADDWAAKFGVTDPNADPDGDGLNNAAEYGQHSDPLVQDSDGDGYSDAEEATAGTSALDSSVFGAAYTQPRLFLSEDKLSFNAKKQEGGAAAPQLVEWMNIGGGTLMLQAAADQPWINASVVGDTIQVGVDHNSLAPGFYSGVVRLSNAAGEPPIVGAPNGHPACIRVNAWVSTADSDVPVTGPVLDKVMYLPLIDR